MFVEGFSSKQEQLMNNRVFIQYFVQGASTGITSSTPSQTEQSRLLPVKIKTKPKLILDLPQVKQH